jgi:hypothetical protein
MRLQLMASVAVLVLITSIVLVSASAQSLSSTARMMGRIKGAVMDATVIVESQQTKQKLVTNTCKQDVVQVDSFARAARFGQARLVGDPSKSGSNKSASSEVNFSIGKIRLGSTYGDVRRLLGMPTKQQRETNLDTSCIPPSTILTLDYDGLRIQLYGPLKGKTFIVFSVEVVASKWLIRPGIRVGLAEHFVRSRLGTPAEESNEGEFHRLHYVNKRNDGFAVLYFKDRILIKVSWESALC